AISLAPGPKNITIVVTAQEGPTTKTYSIMVMRGTPPTTRALAWGDNGIGQLGNSSTTDSETPVAVNMTGVLAGKTIVSMASGGSHSLAVCMDGTVAVWGGNENGQLGNNSSTESSVPVAVNTAGVLVGKMVIAVAAGYQHSVALCSDGTLAAWGDNFEGQLGDNKNSAPQSLVPVAVTASGALAGKMAIAVSAGYYHTLALCSDGTMVAWGSNRNGQLGNNSLTDSPVPVAVNTSGVLAGKTVVLVAAGVDHSLALCSDGTLAAWGMNSSGQLGNNSTDPSLVPVAVDRSDVLAGKTVVALAAGAEHSLALGSDGTAAAWGGNNSGQLGNNSSSDSSVPVAVDKTGVLAGKIVVGLVAGAFESLALCSDGSMASWGFNSYAGLESEVPGLVSTAALNAGEHIIGVFSGSYARHNLAIAATDPVIDPSTNANLASLVPSAGTLAPVFTSTKISYTASVPNGTESMTVTPTVADVTATVKVNGTMVASGSASGVIILAVGSNTITTVVTAQNGTTTKTYTLTVTRAAPPSNNANLSALVLNAGSLTPAFAGATLSYTGSVGYATSSITVKPTVAQANATVKVNGTTVASGVASGAISLNVGENPIMILVTAQDGMTTKTYTLVVTRAPGTGTNAALASLVLSAGTLSPAFAGATINYTASVPSVTNAITIKPTVAQAGATVRVNGTSVASGSVSSAIGLAPGSNVITTVVTASDAATTKTYSLTITRETAATTAQRTLAYHQITTAFGGISGNSVSGPLLSRNGQVIAFTKEVSGIHQVFTIRSDGTGLTQVDSYAKIYSTSPQVDISDDGTRFCVSDATQLRAGGRQILLTNYINIHGIRISGDGTKVFFRVDGDTAILNTTTAIQRGIWVINYDGTGLRQVVGPVQMAPLLGVAAADVPSFATSDGRGVDVSTNGSRIVFSMHNAVVSGGAGQGLFGVNLDGTGLHDFLGRVLYVYRGIISGDGTKVGYDVFPLTGPEEAGVFNFDGSGRRKLADTTNARQVEGLSGHGYHQLTTDGSKLLLGDSGLLINTDGSGVVQLCMRGVDRLLQDYMYNPTMNADGTMFQYICTDDSLAYQLAICYLNPESLGKAPSLTSPNLNPPYILPAGNSTTKLTTAVSAFDAIQQVGSHTVRDGYEEGFLPANLNDAGTSGDTVAGDGVFTTTGLYLGILEPLGPREVRVHAGVLSGDGRRHATAIDLSPFALVSAIPPTVATLPATNVTPTSATLNGTAQANGASTTVSFEYGTSTFYGTTVAATPSPVSGSSDTTVSAALTGLTSGVTYHYRIIGANANGTSSGAGMTFSTGSASNNANLSALTLSAGTLTPAFASATTSYTASVPNSTTSVTVTPTVAQAEAAAAVNGTPVASSTASNAINLAVGANTITTVVT
ncbi:MAG: cadherin-like beta sandwich domain-containing protein, partial [Prosthecobacter sp.]|nr:cadherin-like beta sandwich domain-containing protein [Prosthecobacter sp.]